MDSATDTIATGGPAIAAFVSYSRDDRSRAELLVRALEQHGITVWWDGLIEGGNAFSERIEAALDQADVVIVLWSAHSVHSHWVRDEASTGRDRGRMVPVTLDGSLPPLGFRQLHQIDLSGWSGNARSPDLARLISAVTTVAGAAPPVPATPLPARAPAVSRRTALVAGGAAVLAGGGAAAWHFRGVTAAAASIGVLPFRNMSGDSAQDYLSDGLTEEVRATLSQNRQLQVAARTSSEKVHGDDSPQSVAQALGVRYLLDGSVRRQSNLFRITARIIDGQTGFDTWSQSFDRDVRNILDVESEVADAVTDALVGGVLFSSRSPAQRIGGTANPDALDAYLHGAALYRLAGGKESDFAALAQFERAVALDPKFGVAQAARSRALTVIANNYVPHGSIKTYYDRSIAAARTAITVAPDLADGYSALGFVLINGELDAHAAQPPYQRSFDLGFGDADILSAYGSFAAHVGDFARGREAIARAQRLDPLNPTVFRNAGLLEYWARDFGAAVPPLRTALSLSPKGSNIRVTLGDIQYLGGDYAGARSLYDAETDDIARLRGLAMADRRLGQAASAQAELDQLTAKYGDIALYQQVQIFAQWGDLPRALGMAERALAAGDAGLVLSRNDPLLDPIRKSVRFQSVQRRLGFA